MEWEETEGSHSFGQKVPPLYVHIKEVLQEYPDGQIFKEIIQNADDAGARTVRFYLDNRQHGTHSLVHGGLARFQGPALLAYNDAQFTQEDWKGIENIKLSVKKEDPFKIGKFGIGFNCVYHVTDLPTILSGSTLAFLEPREVVWKGESGQKFTLSECHHRRRYRDSLAPFNGICDFSSGTSTFPGTIFRFPLRDTPSKLSDKVYTVDKLRELTDALKSDAKLLLLFLRSVDTIEVREIGRNGRHKQIFCAAISDRDRMHVHQARKRFIERLRAVHRQQSYGITQRLDLDIDCHVQVVNSLHVPPVESHWLVSTQVGCPEQDVLTAAGRQHNLPWVGAAMEVTDHPTQVNGRIFCFLPLPSDASSNLPVHLNGTFGLSSNRRMLKWTGSESRNDPEAQWNELLVRHLIPPCYERLLMLAKQYFTADQFYQAWPKVSSVRYTPWEKLLLPLFQSLFQQTTLRVGPPLRQWITPQQGVFIPEHNSEFPEVVKRALASCRVKVVSIPQVIWEALHYSNYHVTTVTPSYTRRAIRSKTSSYSSFRSKEKQKLLSYCLSDANYSGLQGLALLQMANGTYATFQLNSMLVASLYICSNDVPRSLLPNLDNLLVDLSRENPKLHDTLQKVADSKATQLQHLSVQTVAQLLPSCMPEDWQSRNTVSLPSNAYPLEWFQIFWEWISRSNHNLPYFEGQLVIPVSTGAGQRQFNVTRLSRDSAVVYLPRSVSCHPDLHQAITKLQVKITDQTDFPYVRHHQLLDYLYMYTADGVLSAIACAYKGRLNSLQNVSITKKEASKLCSFLSSTSYYIDDGQKQVLCYLPMYTALEQKQLFSIQRAAELSWGGKVTVEPEAFNISHSCLPSNLIILSRSSQVPLLTVTQRVQTPTQVEFILNTLYPMIRSGHYPNSQTDDLMMEILRLIPVLKSQLSRSQIDELVMSTGNLCFIQTANGTRRSPKDLFDPSIADLKALYQGEPVFPLAPFDDKELCLCLRACGLQTTVKGQQIISVMESICVKKSLSPVLVGRVKFTRAKAVLKYLSSCDKQFFSEKVSIPSVSHRYWYPLSQAISLLSSRFNCLPVCNKPPKSFPSCLVWKGRAYPSHFVSLTSEVLLPTHSTSDTLPCITGTQMYVVDCSLSSLFSKQLTSSPQHAISPGKVAEHVWNHFKLIIEYCRQMASTRLDAIVSDVYDYLEDHGEEICELDSTKWIWIRRHHTFVCPEMASLKENPTFPHSLEPFYYVIPEKLALDYSSLFRRHGAEKEMTQSQIVSVLGMIKDRKRPELDGKKALNMVLEILKWLTNDGREKPELDNGDTLFVPIQTTSNYPKLVKPERAVYTDNKFLQEFLNSSGSAEHYAFVDEHISIRMAGMLGVTPLSQHLHISEDTFEDIGQHEPLVTRLKNILQDYRDGITIIKELLQNADDAEATEVNICYDARTHSAHSKTLLYAGMVKCHGPALVVHNNASFTKDDFVNITRLAGETKMDKPLKIGKFGVGFCSVYHITDIPCFVSQDMLYIFDPTMSHLGKEIRDAARPGKKVKFTDKIIISSNQLLPFVGMYGFNKRKSYRGTIFRFPFRTEPSEISDTIYQKSTFMQLLKDFRQCSSQLILFLRNVKKITISQIKPGDHNPERLFCVRKSSSALEGNPLASIHSITSSTANKEYWLVATHSDQNAEVRLTHKYATASVACFLDLVSDSHRRSDRYSPRAVDGEIFCFLPLAVHSGLPVHVSSNFAVMKSRKGIQASSDPSDMLAQFNVGLMEHIVPKAYYNLLKTLQAMCKEGQVPQKAYQFFSLWPLEDELRTHNPWDRLIAPLYQLISSNELFFSESICKWFTLSGSKFLAPGILSTESTVESIPKCVIKVLQILQLTFVRLPEAYCIHLPQDELKDSTVNERMFLELFFNNISKLQHDQVARNDVLKCILRTFAYTSDHRQQYIEEALTNKHSVPCTPDGKVLKHCKDVIDPRAAFAKLYDPNDHVFPVSELCEKRLLTALADLGMIRSLMPWHMLAERAQTVKILYQSDQTRALERAKLIIECMDQNLSSQFYYSYSSRGNEEVCRKIQSIPFLPVMKCPEDYPVQWCGDGCGLLSGQKLLHSSQKNVRLAGSQLPIVCTKSPGEGGCGRIPSRVRQHLGIIEHPDSQTVIEQWYRLISKFKTKQTLLYPVKKWLEEICSDIYSYLNRMIDEATINFTDLKRLKCRSCVWTGERFVCPSLVAMNWSHAGPYLYALPHTLKNNPRLADALGILERFNLDNYLSALERVHKDFSDHPVSQRCLQMVSIIVQGLDTCELPDGTMCFLPDENSIMCHTSQLSYNDAPWCQVGEHHRFVNKTIPREAAVKLGVKPVRTRLMERYESSMNRFAGVPFGQREHLTQRIRNILTQYPCDETILKELLQNADDAKATKMYVILDRRTHGKKMVPKEEWADLQGPALLVWNDSVFEEKDIQGIQELGLGSKRSEEESIGQYGIGFNVVYNITDCPSFITYCDGETLCVLDPHCRYVPGADEQNPGRRYDKLDAQFWSNYADLKAPYLREGITGCPPEVITSGSLFRFPLRSTQELVDKSELVDKHSSKGNSYSYTLKAPMSALRMLNKFKEWTSEIKQALFFLNHITEIKFFIIGERLKRMSPLYWYKVNLSQEAQTNRKALHGKTKAFGLTERDPHVVHYPLTLTERSPSMQGLQEEKSETWLIQQGVGDLMNRDQEWKFSPQVKPKHGIAAPLQLTEETKHFRGIVFCFLPLPIHSHLPVHVNGNFILDSSRRDLWHSTRKDDPDDRTKWNQRLIEAIASSYVNLLDTAKQLYVDPRHSLTYGVDQLRELFARIHHYYGTFPTWLLGDSQMPPEGLFRFLAETVYQKLGRNNARVMVTVQKVPHSETPSSSRSRISKARLQAKSSVEWHPLRNDEEPSKQVYFWKPSDKELTSILESIGMKLSVAPMSIRNHFAHVKIKLPEATRDTVFQYYSQFHHQVSPMGGFPCHISDTAFKSVDQFRKFSLLLLGLPTDESACSEFPGELLSSPSQSRIAENEFPGDPFDLPLLLTADDQLKAFNKNNMVIRSSYHEIFPHSKDKFLHPAMLSVQYSCRYFVQESSKNWPMVRAILQKQLPNSLEDVRVLSANTHVNIASVLCPLWLCLSQDIVFQHHLKDILEHWALLLSTHNQLFAFRSWEQLLPVIPSIANEEIRFEPTSSHEDQYQPVFKVLQRAGMPVLDTTVVPCYIARNYCPTFSTPLRILTNLYYLHMIDTEEEGLTQLLTERDADNKIIILCEYFKHIHFAQDRDSLGKLKQLPLFKDVSGKLRTLEGNAYIWPRHICSVGSSKWLAETPAVFLKRDGAWSKLEVDPKVLGIKYISVLDVYTEFIFPSFSLLSSEEKYKQLEHIRDQLFYDANNDKESKDKEKSSSAQRFISGLKTLPLLPLPGGELGIVMKFCDPSIPLFTTFHQSFAFPPEEFCTPEWLKFLRSIGLRQKVTQEEFIKYCKKVSIGEHEDLRKASETLLEHLMKTSAWYNKPAFLGEVSNIPFVLVQPLPSLDWIKSIYPAENRIQQGQNIFNLTRLNGAALYRDCRRLLWTVKSVIELPRFAEGTKPETVAFVKEQLGIVTTPRPSDVVDNLKNISESRFSNFALFDKYTHDCKPKQKESYGDCSLVKVVKDNFRFLCEHAQSRSLSILDSLKDLPCIPVCSEGKLSRIQLPVLVKPLQVVVGREEEELREARPFINPLPFSLMEVLELLLQLGVANSVHPIHIRVALETIHSHIKQPLDINTVKVVQYLLMRLHALLKDCTGVTSQKYADSLSPLFLPNTKHQLVRTTQLICNDMHQYRNILLDFSGLQYSLLDFLEASPRLELRCTPTELCRCLPSAVSPVLLSSCCEQQLHDSCTETPDNTHTADDLQRTFDLYVWIAKAAEHILHKKGQAVDKEECSKFTASLQGFLQRIKIVAYQNLKADIYLTLVTPKRKIGTTEVPCLIQKMKEGGYCLCVSGTTSFDLLNTLSRSIVSRVVQLSGVDPKSIGNPEAVIRRLLEAESLDNIESILEENDLSADLLTLGDVDIPVSSQCPKLGEPIPSQWHDQLDQDVNNIFRPEELVGYEECEGHIVLARVIYRVSTDEEEGYPQYRIHTRGDDEEGKVVSVLDLYKFRRTDSTSVEHSREIACPEGSDAAQLLTSLHEQGVGGEWKDIKKEICTDLRRIWRLPEEDKRKGVKRLYLKWHPDKNSHPLATKAFQFLMQQISRLEAEEEDNQRPSPWDDLLKRWNIIVEQHRRSRSRGRRGGINTTHLDEMTPEKDMPTAKVWLQQAEVDAMVMQTVLSKVNVSPKHAAHTCFLAHEVAEKALKAGKYATSGLSLESLRNHDLAGHAGGLEQLEPQLTTGLRTNAQALERYYLWTRYPNKYSPPSVPAIHFTPDQARVAYSHAEKILQMMRAVIQQAQKVN